jgi:hypothetical protein
MIIASYYSRSSPATGSEIRAAAADRPDQAVGRRDRRLTRLASQYAAGLISRARVAFALRWSGRRRRHQAAARWHHHSTRLLAAAT